MKSNNLGKLGYKRTYRFAEKNSPNHSRLRKMEFSLSLIIFIASILFICSSPAIASYEKEEVIHLSLAEVIRQTVENNFGIELAQLDAEIGATQLPLQKAIFDTILKGEAHLVGKGGPEAMPYLGVARNFPTGTIASLTFIDMENLPLGPPPAPVVNSALELSLTQPLLKNRGGLIGRGSVELTRLGIKNINFISQDRIEEIIATTEKAYWNLVFAYEILQTKENMLRWAEELVNLNEELFEMGLIEKVDILTSEANLSLRQLELLVAENGFQSAVNGLKFLINDTTPTTIIPVTGLTRKDKEIILETELQKAFLHRRDYQKAQVSIQASDLQLKIKANSRLPQLDLTGSLRWQKLDTQPRGVFANDPDYFLGIELSFPLGGGKARSEYNRALLEKEQALVNLEMVERIIATEVDEKVRAVEISNKQIEQHLRIVELQRLQLEEEMKRFEHGRSRSDIVVRFREALLKTEMALIKSLVSYNKSWVDLRRTQNILLDKWGI